VRTLWQQRYTIAAFLVGIAGTALIVFVPPILDFGLAVATAIGWCAWLEHNPSP
jgi:hypothetical protein